MQDACSCHWGHDMKQKSYRGGFKYRRPLHPPRLRKPTRFAKARDIPGFERK